MHVTYVLKEDFRITPNQTICILYGIIRFHCSGLDIFRMSYKILIMILHGLGFYVEENQFFWYLLLKICLLE